MSLLWQGELRGGEGKRVCVLALDRTDGVHGFTLVQQWRRSAVQLKQWRSSAV